MKSDKVLFVSLRVTGQSLQFFIDQIFPQSSHDATKHLLPCDGPGKKAARRRGGGEGGAPQFQ